MKYLYMELMLAALAVAAVKVAMITCFKSLTLTIVFCSIATVCIAAMLGVFVYACLVIRETGGLI